MNEHHRAEGTRSALLGRLLEEARKRLIETGARNRLIHVPRDAKKSRSLAILNAVPDSVLAYLVRERRSLVFRATEDTSSAVSQETTSLPRLTSSASSDAAFDGALQTSLTPEALQKRLLRSYRDARTLEEEQGVNILFLAIGFLRWFEDETSNTPREAPLILVPVALVRDNARSHFRLVAREEDIEPNLPLQERLKTLGIGVPDFPHSESWRASDYFASVREAVFRHGIRTPFSG